MAFVNELIPAEQKNKFSFPVSTRSDGSKPTLWKWTIDRERDAYLVLAKTEGGAYEGTQQTEHYVLSWKSHQIRFAGDPAVKGSIETGQTMSWRIHQLNIPVELKGQEAVVCQLIREALDAMGWLYRRQRVVEVNISFDLVPAQ